MAVLKIVKKVQNVAASNPDNVTMPVFSYSDDGLAKLIVDAWQDDTLRNELLDRSGGGVPTERAVARATKEVNKAGTFRLKRAVVITEKEHDDDYVMQSEDEVVFVLPNRTRVASFSSGEGDLLKTARILMACTPNGI